MDLHKQLQLQQQVMQQQMMQHHQQLQPFPEHGMQHYQQPQYQQPQQQQQYQQQYHQHVPGAVPIHLQEPQQQLIEDLQTINYSEDLTMTMLSRDCDLLEHDEHF